MRQARARAVADSTRTVLRSAIRNE
eukprot:COSAG05_NODE_9603_length_612_cov_1.539961_1_plen_24_part_10